MIATKVLDKVKKLLALSENNPSMEEAQAAMLKAQELMLDNNLTMADISNFDTASKEKVVDHNHTDISRARMPWWWENIGNVVAENFKCHMYVQANRIQRGEQRVKHLVLIGLEEDVAVAVATIRFAIKAAELCFKEYRRIQLRRAKARGARRPPNVKNDYMFGFIQGLKASFAKQVMTKDLIIVKDQLVEAKFADIHLKHTKSKIAITGDTEARRQGRADGRMAKKDSYIQ